jgi:predicted NUDIX family NTP pyrophosphohydrolase
MIMARMMRWAGHEARMGEKRNANRILVVKPEGSHWEDRDVGAWTILRWILEG